MEAISKPPEITLFFPAKKEVLENSEISSELIPAPIEVKPADSGVGGIKSNELYCENIETLNKKNVKTNTINDYKKKEILYYVKEFDESLFLKIIVDIGG
ncbi:MAG: hypothetical protein KDK36_21810, partial [Leptospiraceae bacterium]|nr:hypothetical protein [Leptospiraceae bacterium]